MDLKARYFDNAATSPLDPRVREEMLVWMGESFGNASSLHHFGQRARAAVESAREAVAELVDASDPSEVVFTSGATEVNNWVLSCAGKLAVSPFEHSSVREPSHRPDACELKAQNWTLDPPSEAFDFLSAQLVNNETGSFVDASAWHRTDPSEGLGAAFIHRDLTQAAGKFSLHDHPYDFGSFAAHKFHGPMGIGVLHMRGAVLSRPFITGGGQEGGLRGGTLNVPGIVGLGAAAKIALDEMEKDLYLALEVRSILVDAIDRIPDTLIVERVGQGVVQSPYILCSCFAGLYGEALVIELDNLGYGISSGAACSSGTPEPSHVLRALGLPDELAKGAARFSFGRFNTLNSASELARLLPQVVDRVRSLGQS